MMTAQTKKRLRGMRSRQKKETHMYDPEDQFNPIRNEETPHTEQTDRVNGEYHYKNGYTQRIYSDAHYVREDETTVPPRYYTPPEKPVREARPPKEKKTVGLGARIALCLVCALLGGLCGGAVADSLMDSRMDKLETNVAEDEEERRAKRDKKSGNLSSD